MTNQHFDDLEKVAGQTSLEIERKFLVGSGYLKAIEGLVPSRIKPGYIVNEEDRAIRVRVKDDEAFLTIKGASLDGGLSRPEVEKQITLDEAELLLQMCEGGFIYKDRYKIPHGSQVVELDVFHGDNEGLVVAEIELKSVDEEIEWPDYFTIDVTGLERYYNAQLIKTPYSVWEEKDAC